MSGKITELDKVKASCGTKSSDTHKATDADLPPALTPEMCAEKFGGAGRKVFNQICNVGGFGSFKPQEHHGLSLDLSGLAGETREAAQAIFDRAYREAAQTIKE